METGTTRGVMVNGRTLGTIQSDPSDSEEEVRRKVWALPRVVAACGSLDAVVWDVRPFVVKLSVPGA